MSQIYLSIIRADTNQEFEAELPGNIIVSKLLPELISKLGLPITGPDGNRISYELSNKRTGKNYLGDLNLEEQDTKNGDILILTTTFIAGYTKKDTRLIYEYGEMIKLKESADWFDFEAFGDPPNQYIITFRCNGLKLVDEKPEIVNFHQCKITIGSFYPSRPPDVIWLTTIFHPNIRGQAVCHSNQWAASWTLTDFVIELSDMVRFKKYNIDSPLDKKAAEWVKNNLNIIPLDNRDLRACKALG